MSLESNQRSEAVLPSGVIALWFSILLLGLCVFLPFEIQIGGGRITYLSPWSVILIAVCLLLVAYASAKALLHPRILQKSLGVAASAISAWILTLTIGRIVVFLFY